MRVLNLYAGIGGNRKLWNDVDITAIENDPQVAAIYQDFYPEDTVIIGDAHQFLLEHYKDFDFIWASPPCQSHSRIRKNMGVVLEKVDAIYPDMALWQEIIFLQHHCKSTMWVVENVIPYYDSLVKPSVKLGRHFFWANFLIPSSHTGGHKISHFRKGKIKGLRYAELATLLDVDLSAYKHNRKDQILRNCVDSELGLHIFNAARYSLNGKATHHQQLVLSGVK